jgi:predicted metal-dependent phosphoesterase TrpH
LALACGLRAIALTDHDTLSGVAEAQAAAAGTGLEVVTGVEVSVEGGLGSLHLLGFHVDVEKALINEKLQAMRDARMGRTRKMVERLRELGMPLEWEEVRALAGGESVGRPHVARALLDRGYVATLQEAFDRLVGHGGLAYISRPRLTPLEAIQAITDAGGLPVLAHPAYSGAAAMERIPELVGCGLRGLEVYYPHHSPEEVEMLLGLCQKHGVLATGGSDFHGPGSEEGAPLGSVYVPLACVERLREAITSGADRASAPQA